MRISDWSSDVCSSDLLPVRGAGGFIARDDAILAGDVDLAKNPADRVGDRPTTVRIDVEDRDLHSRRRERLGARAAEARRPAGDHCRNFVVELHRRSEEHTSELQSLMRISYAVFCLKKKKTYSTNTLR